VPDTPTLSEEDADAIARLVAATGDRSHDAGVPERKRALLEGVAALVDADVWYWSTSVLSDTSFDIMAVTLIDGGWQDLSERARFFETVSDPRLADGNQRVLDQAGREAATFDLSELLPRETVAAAWDLFQQMGFEHILISTRPIARNLRGIVALYRRVGRPAFSVRDRRVVHLSFKHLGWLDRETEDLVAPHRALRLSPRERQVLAFLMAGHSPKEIAGQLRLSQHTVGDYIKKIYRHFSVSGRAELLSQFIGGAPKKS